MENQLKEVLVIDDTEDFAEEAVEYINLHCGVKAIYASDGEQAIEKLKQNPIKIILLDYDFKKAETGLDLFPKLKEIDPHVKIVFMSAVATTEVLYKAENYRFDAKIVKTALASTLPQLIPTLLIEYSNSFETTVNKIFFSKKNYKLISCYTVDYSIISYQILNKEYTYPDSWSTYQMITSGETKTNQKEFEYEKTFELERNFNFENNFNFEMGSDQLFNFKTKLSTQLENVIKSGYTEKISGTIRWMKELSLNENIQNNSIISRFYDYAQLYMQIKIFIKRTCSCCGDVSIFPITVYFPLPSIKYRIREYYDDESQKSRTINTGIYRG